ncbi:MAG: hypothetical protein QM736_15155 [Vicinamibacterales bacterium]
MKPRFGPRPTRTRTPGLSRPRCTAVRARDGATCDKPEHDNRQSHRWSTRNTTQPPRRKFELRKAATALLSDTRYHNRLMRDLRARKLKPSVEVMLWHMAVGKPPGSVEHVGEISLLDEMLRLTPEELHARALAIVGMLTEDDDDDQ